MRQASLDVPSLEPRRRMGLVRNQVTEQMYRVTIDNATITGVTFDPSAIVRGARVQVVWHPERNFWEIEQIAEATPVLPYSTYLLQYWALNAGGPTLVRTYDGGVTWPDAFDPFTPFGSGHETSDLYYERWNGIAQPNRLHFMQQHGNEGLFYNYADLGSGTAVLGTPIDLGINYAPLGVKGSSIIVTPNGRIRIDGYSIGGGPGGGRSHYSDDGVTFSSALAPAVIDWQPDRVLGWHDRSTGLDDSVIYLYHDDINDTLSVKRTTAGGGAITETFFGGSFPWTSSAGGENWASTMNSNGNGHISLIAWTSDVLATSKSLKAFDIYGATITARTDVVTSETYVQLCALTRLPDGITLRAFYTKDSAGASDLVEIYYKDSLDEMVTWGAETLHFARTAGGNQIAKLAIDPLPGVGPPGEEAPVWWLEGTVGGNGFVWQVVNGAATQSFIQNVEVIRENAGTTRGQIAWITVP